jgi:hypothetical protein
MADESDAEIKVDIGNLGDAVAPNGHDKDAPKVEVAADPPAPAAEAKAAKATLTPEEGIQKLQKQLEDERALRERETSLREDAERRAAEASDGELRAKTDSHQNQLDMLGNAIANLTSANDLLKQKYSAALASQDFDGAATAQLEMSTNAAKLIQLESGKANLERAGKPTARQQVPTDAVERFAANLTPKSAAWVRAHPDYARDPKKNRKMIAAHEIAMADGYAAESDEYFASIEQTLGLRNVAPEPADDDPPLSEASRPTSRRSPPAAPPSRSGTGRGGSSATSVTLSREEAEIAKLNGMTLEEYAKNKLALTKEGRLN